ncbi:brassinosteroid signaling positive regulator-related family protein [Striga asiatica]|uniref:Protein BZR1 homolog n=1 Tax=Striga asiatica TaxID=4170 RepID=A0A5A7PLR5_STRAF|nr:brassinosteroid signaling positive regulator-related family protein [Striga asiatica]
MTGGARMPTWKERENNKRRERRRRAIAAKIFAGLRLYGNYKLPKHCDNNEVLKALCGEAGWTVEPDGTTYRRGCRPAENLDMGSLSASPCSSYQPSPHTSYNPSPASSSFPSPASSAYPPSILADGNSLIPWLRNLSSSTATSAKCHLIHAGSISAPVTPPLSSPTARTPRLGLDWDNGPFARPGWAGPKHPFLPLSTPPSPGRWLAGAQIQQSGPASPTFSLVSANPFGFTAEDLSRAGPMVTCTPGQSGTCSPAVGGGRGSDVPMADVGPNEFAFGNDVAVGLVKPWKGERIHEEFGSDELELTLGSSKTRLPQIIFNSSSHYKVPVGSLLAELSSLLSTETDESTHDLSIETPS